MANILFVNKMSPKGQGGAETRIREVARRLARAGHRVYVVCGRTSPTEPDSEDDEGVHIHYVPVLPRWLLRRLRPGHYLPQAMFYFVAGPAILRALKRWKIDVIRDSISPFPALGLLSPWLARRAVAVTHILYKTLARWRRYYGTLYGLFGYLAERLLLGGRLPYRCLITDSHWLANDLRGRVRGSLRVRSILNGIDVGRFAKRCASPNGTLRILNVARCTSHKCQSDLLNACVILRGKGLRVEATLVGDGPLRKHLEAQAGNLKLAESVRFLGAIPQEQMKSLYANYDLLVIASESEGLPVALLEAMASRLPVIAPDAPYVTELAPNAAEMIGTYRLHDPESLAAMVSETVASPDTAARRERGAWEWVQRLTWDEVAAKEWEEMRVLLSQEPAEDCRSTTQA